MSDVINGVPRDWLKQLHRDLDACQKLIWANLRGCDPAYCADAQARLAEIETMLATAQPAAEVIETDCRSEEGVTVGLIDALIAICRPLATRDLTPPATCAALEDLRSDSDALAIFLGLPPAADGEREVWAVPVLDGEKKTTFYTEQLPFVPGIGVKQLGEPVRMVEARAAQPAADGERVAFEAVYAGRCNFERNPHHPDIYANEPCRARWEAWQARAALPAKAEGVAVPEGFALVPLAPTEAQWSGLARHIMMWLDMGRPTVKALRQHLDMLGVEIPAWLESESEMKGEGVPSKGTRVAIIYRAMIEDYLAAAPVPPATIATFTIGDHVRKTKGSRWQGRIVGAYSTALTPEGYAVESDTETGSVQIYPVSALERVRGDRGSSSGESFKDDPMASEISLRQELMDEQEKPQ